MQNTWEEKCIQHFNRNPWRGRLGGIDIVGQIIILKWILEQQNVRRYAAVICLRIGISDGMLWTTDGLLQISGGLLCSVVSYCGLVAVCYGSVAGCCGSVAVCCKSVVDCCRKVAGCGSAACLKKSMNVIEHIFTKLMFVRQHLWIIPTPNFKDV